MSSAIATSAATETEDIPAKSFDVEINGLTKTFGESTVVDNLCLNIERGTFLGLIGANGAGKSTTLKMLSGMLEQTSGQANVFGTSIDNLGPEQTSRIGYVPDTHQIYRWMTVKEAVWFCKRLNPRWNDEQCAALLNLFHLEHTKKVKSLSKGMLAKLGLALALSHEPDLLILDEPMSGLDPIAREEFLDGVLKTVSDQNCTVILSSHSIADVERMSDSICLLHDGKMLAHRKTEQMLQRTKRVRFKFDGNGDPPRLESSIWTRNNNHDWSVTVADYSSTTTEMLEQSPNVSHVEVHEICLEEIYKDYVRGQNE